MQEWRYIMIRRLLAVLRGRGETADPVDEHYLTAVAALCPDELLDADELRRRFAEYDEVPISVEELLEKARR